MLRSSLQRSGNCLSRAISPLKRSACSTATLRASAVPSVRQSRLPRFTQYLQSRQYAVAAEDTNKGVVSSLDGGNGLGIDEETKK